MRHRTWLGQQVSVVVHVPPTEPASPEFNAAHTHHPIIQRPPQRKYQADEIARAKQQWYIEETQDYHPVTTLPPPPQRAISLQPD